MSPADEDNLGFESSAQELQQILPKNVFDSLAPVQGGQWHIHRRGPNEYEAVYSLRTGSGVYALASHKVSTVISLDEVYGCFPVHRSRSLDGEQTERILPQIQHLLYRPDADNQIAQRNITNAAASGTTQQHHVLLDVSFSDHQAHANQAFQDGAEKNLCPERSYQAGAPTCNHEASGSFATASNRNIAAHETIVEPHLSENGINSHLPSIKATHHEDDDISNDGNENSESSPSNFSPVFVTEFAMHNDITAQPARMNLSATHDESLGQHTWANSSRGNFPEVGSTQGPDMNSDINMMLNDFEREQMEFYQNLGAFAATNQMTLADQAVIDTQPQSPPLNGTSLTADHQLNNMQFSTDMAGYLQGGLGQGEPLYFNGGGSINDDL